MLLPSGPANTRCSVCRFDPARLHVQLRPAPGTGLQRPETGSQNRRYRDLSWRQRPHVPHLNPRKCPQIAGCLSETGKHRFASDCVVVDAARIEPVSTPQFPLSGKLTAYFADSGPSRRFSRPIDGLIQWLAAQFPTQQNSESFSRNSEFVSRNSESSVLCVNVGA
jgi:hypothetical protein